MQHGNGNMDNYIPRSSWVGTATETHSVQRYCSHRYPLTKRAGFAFNRIAPAAQAERQKRKSVTWGGLNTQGLGGATTSPVWFAERQGSARSNLSKRPQAENSEGGNLSERKQGSL